VNFRDIPVSRRLLTAIEGMGITTPLPVQEAVIPLALARQDVVACAPTGTGKTIAYLLPIMDGLLEMGKVKKFRPRALVLVPTRELAVQVGEVFTTLAAYTELRAAVIYGGVDIGAQDMMFQNGADFVVATPGRLLEHLERKGLKFNELEYLVLDEADRLLDAGFLPELQRLVDQIPDRRQTMLFSATMPPAMEQLARELLSEPERVQVGQVAPKDTVEERAYHVVEEQKIDLLKVVLSRETSLDRVLVFVRTRARARELPPILAEATGLAVAELHADLSQKQRLDALEAFRSGEMRVLVATDVASRGLDIEGLSHVVNFDVPNTADEYIHRVGRTGRVDRQGVALTLVAPEELTLFLALEEATRRRIVAKRLDGFAYIFPEDPVFGDGTGTTKSRKSGGPRSFRPKAASLEKKESPFTKSGQLKREFQDKTEEGPKRNSRKRTEKRIRNKKLPHQRGS
jgi:ATP-dependent RNA helicase RhlE